MPPGRCDEGFGLRGPSLTLTPCSTNWRETMPKGEHDALTPERVTGYEVTNNGQVFSVRRGREMVQAPNDDGYPSVRLTVNGKRTHYAVHRLVALFYLPSRPSINHEIRHLDGDKGNNDASNLCWGTRLDNAKDRDRHGRTSRGERRHNAVLTSATVREIRYKHCWMGMSTRTIARLFSVSQSAVQHVHKWPELEARIMTTDTPGPFYTPERSSVIRKRGRKGTQHITTLGYGIDITEREELVDLLNKGTHFEDLVGALRAAVEKLPSGYAKTYVKMSIAKAEGKDDAN